MAHRHWSLCMLTTNLHHVRSLAAPEILEHPGKWLFRTEFQAALAAAPTDTETRLGTAFTSALGTSTLHAASIVRYKCSVVPCSKMKAVPGAMPMLVTFVLIAGGRCCRLFD